MSVIQKLFDAQNNQDIKAYNEVVSEDYVWVKHSTGEEIPRDELSKWLISPDAPKTENARIIYENNEIGVAHFFVSFKDSYSLLISKRFSLSLILTSFISKIVILSNNSPADISVSIFLDLLVIYMLK